MNECFRRRLLVAKSQICIHRLSLATFKYRKLITSAYLNGNDVCRLTRPPTLMQTFESMFHPHRFDVVYGVQSKADVQWGARGPVQQLFLFHSRKDQPDDLILKSNLSNERRKDPKDTIKWVTFNLYTLWWKVSAFMKSVCDIQQKKMFSEEKKYTHWLQSSKATKCN